MFPPKKAKKLLSCVSILTGYGNLPDKLIRHWTTPASPSFDVSPPPTTCSSKIIREVKIKQKIVKKVSKMLAPPPSKRVLCEAGSSYHSQFDELRGKETHPNLNNSLSKFQKSGLCRNVETLD